MLEALGRALEGALGAEMLVFAADILDEQQQDPGIHDALLVRALQLDPDSYLAVDRTLRASWARGDWLVLADALGLAAQMVDADEARATICAQRAEVIGHRLGRLEESRALYIEAAERSPTLAAGALAAVEDVELRLANPIGHDAVWPEVAAHRVGFDPMVAAGLPLEPPTTPSFDSVRSRLAAGFDRKVFADGLIEGVDNGWVDIARVVLPGWTSEARRAEIESLISEANHDGELDRSARLQAAAFAEEPGSAHYFEAALWAFGVERWPHARVEVLLRRRRVVRSVLERRATLEALGALAAAMGHGMAAAEAYLELLRISPAQDGSALMATIDQLSRSTEVRRLWARALAAASARPGLVSAERRGVLWELARVLDEELEDPAGATALRAELTVTGGSVDRSASDVLSSSQDLPVVPTGSDTPSAAAIRAACQSGDVPAAVRMLKRAQLSPATTYALWREIAELAEVLGQDELARLAYGRAEQRAPLPSERHRAQAGRARVAQRLGAKREAAEALSNVASARRVAEAQLAARDLVSARTTFSRALDQDPSDVQAAGQLVRLHAEDGNRRTVDHLADLMAAQPMNDDRRAVWLTELATALGRLGDADAARRDFVRAMRLDVANVDAATGLVSLGSRFDQPEWVDEGLSSLRARWAARGEWMRAFVASALLVARGRDVAPDRLTYESLRCHLAVQPQAALPKQWVGLWLGLVGDGPRSHVSSRPERDEGPRSKGPSPVVRSWTPDQSLGEIVSTIQALFRAPEPQWGEDDGPGVRIAPGPVVVVGRGVPRWRRRWRFEVGRALAALVEPRLGAGLASTDGPATIEQQVVDRAGLIAVVDPAIALSAVGAHSPRGHKLVPFAISDALVTIWRGVGLGLDSSVGRPWPHRPTML